MFQSSLYIQERYFHCAGKPANFRFSFTTEFKFVILIYIITVYEIYVVARFIS